MEARRRAGLSQAELAQRSGVAASLIGRYERYEVTPSLERLAGALIELGARPRAPEPGGIPFTIEPDVLGDSEMWTLTTAAGDLDICFAPLGTKGYDDLRREASRERLGRDLTVDVASLRDVIRSKEATGRDKDLAQLPLLRRTLEQIRAAEHAQKLEE